MSLKNCTFLRGVVKYSFLLYRWTQDPLTVDFLEAIMGDHVDDQVEYWIPEADNYELGLFQKRFVSDTINRVGRFNLTEHDAIETFSIYLSKAAASFWEDKLRLSHSAFHIDNLIRQTILNPPGPGIGYLSLILASNIPFTDLMLNEIDISRKFSPELPFTSDDTVSLMKITGKETRLRFGLVIANAFGRCCNKLKIELKDSNFKQDFQKMIHHFICSSDLESIDLIRDDLKLIIDILIYSKKESSELIVSPSFSS